MSRAAFFGLFGLVLLPGCLSPTQVTLELSTDVSCKSQPVTTIGVGAPGDVETAVPQTTTSLCTSGSIGSIVVTPSSDNGATFEVQVVLSVGVTPTDCNAGDNFTPKGAPPGTGCIVARREIAFVPHTPLKLPIELDQACLGYKCKKGETCVVEDNAPTCKSARTSPGCAANDTCAPMTTSATGISAGGAGMGGAGMGGAGMGGAGMGGENSTGGGSSFHCPVNQCGECPGDCAEASGDPMHSYRGCPTTIAVCSGVTGCCDGNECVQVPALPPARCALQLTCSGTQGYTCTTNQWDANHPCAHSGDMPLKAGFFGFQVNTCVPSTCGTGCPGTELCALVRESCCADGNEGFGFACIRHDEECCGDGNCSETGAECVNPSGTDVLRCSSCGVIHPSGSTGANP